jgi:hypothetical protein
VSALSEQIGRLVAAVDTANAAADDLRRQLEVRDSECRALEVQVISLQPEGEETLYAFYKGLWERSLVQLAAAESALARARLIEDELAGLRALVEGEP